MQGFASASLTQLAATTRSPRVVRPRAFDGGIRQRLETSAADRDGPGHPAPLVMSLKTDWALAIMSAAKVLD